ncbi:hypothetical protein [Naasia aerilata]|nr:hypothetical protein [Naasia aerilata]
MDDDLGEIGTPSCPGCLVPREAEGDARPRWRCPSCKLIVLA